MRRRLGALGLVLILASGATVVGAEPEAPPVPVGPVPRVTLEALPLEIPTAHLSDGARLRANGVLGRTIFAHRVSGIRHRSREAVFRFLVDHPDFAASVVRALRLKQYLVIPLENAYWADDNRGATGLIRLLYADRHRRLFHLEGRYEERRHPTVDGQLLLLFEFHHEPDETGATVVESSVTGYLALDSPLIGALAAIVATLARPLVERAVDRKVHGFFATVSRVSRWAYDAPEELAAALDGHPEFTDEATLEAFRTILLAGRPPAWADVSFRLLPEEGSGP